MKRMLAVAIILVFAGSALAVDGYNEWNWGADKTTIMEDTAGQCYQDSFIGLDALTCPRFKWGDQSTSARIIFFNNKFHQLIINVPSWISSDEVLHSAEKKFGKPSRIPTEAELRDFDKKGISITWGFDKNTLSVTVLKMSGAEETNVTYTSPKFSSLYERFKNESGSSFPKGSIFNP
jgi:hypothetical protein